MEDGLPRPISNKLVVETAKRRTMKDLSNPTKLSIAEAYDIWAEDDSPVIGFSECPICKAEGYPGQTGHSSTSCLADKIRSEDV